MISTIFRKNIYYLPLLILYLEVLNLPKIHLKNNRKYKFYVGFGIYICMGKYAQFNVNITINLGLAPPKGFALPTY